MRLTLAAHVGVTAVKSVQLSEEVAKIVAAAQERITGIGAEQYAKLELQKFEAIPLHELLVMAEEELLDNINYSVMALIRWRSLKKTALDLVHNLKNAGLVIEGFDNDYWRTAEGDTYAAAKAKPTNPVVYETIYPEPRVSERSATEAPVSSIPTREQISAETRPHTSRSQRDRD